jgi:hypoxanthine phosphoribosyltransferase
MARENPLDGKKFLILDDGADTLDSLEELLSTCHKES